MKSFSKTMLAATAGLIACVSAPKADIIGPLTFHMELPNRTADLLTVHLIAKMKELGYIPGKNVDYEFKFSDRDSVTVTHKMENGEEMRVYVPFTTQSAQKFAKEKTGINEVVLFSAITDPKSAGLLEAKNITGVSNYIPVARQIKAITDIIDNVKRLAIMHNPEEANSVFILENAKRAAEEMGLTLVVIEFSKEEDLNAALEKANGMYDALLINENNLALSLLPAIAKKLHPQKLPIISSKHPSLDFGALMSAGVDEADVANATAAMLHRLLKGENVEKIPFKTLKEMRVALNEDLAKNYGLKLAKEKYNLYEVNVRNR